MGKNINEIVFSAVRILQSYPRPIGIADPIRAFPILPVRSLCEQLKIDSAVLYIAPHKGNQPIKRKVIGDARLWNELNEELKNVKQRNNLRKAVFEIPFDSNRQKSRDYPSLGYLACEKKIGFIGDEIQALNEYTKFLSSYVRPLLRDIRSAACEDLLANLFNYTQNKIDLNAQLPGSTIKDIQSLVHKAIGASCSFFTLIENKSIVVDYVQKPQWRRTRFLEQPQTVIVPPTLLKKCFEEEIFRWHDIKAGNELGPALSPIIELRFDGCYYLIAPFRNDNVPFALWIFQFYQNQIVFLDLYEKVIKQGLALSNRAASYLYQRRIKKLIIDPIFNSRETRIDQGLIFTLMPFTEKWSDRIWQKIIKPICKDEGMKPIRADDLYGQDIMEDVWKGIVTSKIVIADITGRNPNVFYELGIAHTIGKPVILLTQASDDIPFDLNRYRHIIYEDNIDGCEQLGIKLKASIKDILENNK